MAEYKSLPLVKQSVLRQVGYLKNQCDLSVMVRLEHYSDDESFDLVVLIFAPDGALISDEVTHIFNSCEKIEAIAEGKALLRKVKSWFRNVSVNVNGQLVQQEF